MIPENNGQEFQYANDGIWFNVSRCDDVTGKVMYSLSLDRIYSGEQKKDLASGLFLEFASMMRKHNLTCEKDSTEVLAFCLFTQGNCLLWAYPQVEQTSRCA